MKGTDHNLADEAVSAAEQEDLRDQHGLLALVLHHHPTILTTTELNGQMSLNVDALRFGEALRILEGAGLLRREGESVFPTIAALTFERLM